MDNKFYDHIAKVINIIPLLYLFQNNQIIKIINNTPIIECPSIVSHPGCVLAGAPKLKAKEFFKHIMFIIIITKSPLTI